MLTNEYFGITIQIANDFDMLFQNVRLTVNAPAHLRNKGTQIKLFLKIPGSFYNFNNQ